MGGFNTQVLAPRTSQILADGNLNMRNYRVINLGRSISYKDAVNLEILLMLMG